MITYNDIYEARDNLIGFLRLFFPLRYCPRLIDASIINLNHFSLQSK
ncbi:Uncharacterised protein [uncultured archaeon]|nr:Uncharacterised protein [uncultured archaeon]